MKDLNADWRNREPEEDLLIVGIEESPNVESKYLI